MLPTSKIFVAGHKGLVGSAIYNNLLHKGFQNVVVKTRQQVNLLDFHAVAKLFETEMFEYVFLAAAKVGGIVANKEYVADFVYQNLQIQTNVIHCAYLTKVKKLIFLGSSCIYPKTCSQPIKEEYLLSGHLEDSNYGYAVAKIAGVTMCKAYQQQYGCNFISIMPTNLYGYNDNFDLHTSHVLPALLRKFHEAKMSNTQSVIVWGTGKPRREFLFADDLAEACIFIMNTEKNLDFTILNVGVGKDISILELTSLIANIVGFHGTIVFDNSKPDGTMQKVLDVSKINQLGWKANTRLKDGIKRVYEWYITNSNQNRKIAFDTM